MVSVAAHKWRDLKCRLMAGFELSTEEKIFGENHRMCSDSIVSFACDHSQRRAASFADN